MRYLKRRVLSQLIRIADLCVMVGAFGIALVVASQTMEWKNVGEYLALRISLLNILFFVGWLVTWFFIFKAFGLYRQRRDGLKAAEWWSVTKAVMVGTLVLSFVAVLLDFSAVDARFLISFACIALLGSISARFLLRAMFAESIRSGGTLRKLVIIGCGPRGAEFGQKVRSRPDFGYLFLGYIDEIPPPENPLHGGPEKILGPPSDTKEILESLDVDEVVITLPIASHYQTISDLIAICEDLSVDVLVPTDFFQSRLVNVAVDDSRAWPAMELRNSLPSVGGIFIKRAIDIAVSLVALIVLSPLLVVVAIAIKLDSPGPVFFRQTRVGLKRKKFQMHKFRTMTVDAEEKIEELESLNEVDGAAFKITDDPRVTTVGKTLRKLSLDEVPQFVDVLRGEMSLVGPRPLPIRDVEKFEKSWQKRRFSVKPGLTCLWQVNGRHDLDFEHWMELDLQYVDNWSLSMDLDILMKTVPAVFKGTGSS